MPLSSESTPLLEGQTQAPTRARLPFICRVLVFVVSMFLTFICLLIALILCCICCPCICCCCFLFSKGFDFETLDGANAKPDAATEKEVQQARKSPSPYHEEIEYFAQLGENLQRNLTREFTLLQIDDPTDVPAKRECLLQGVTNQKNRPFLLTIQVDREHILEQTLQCLCSVPANRLLARHLHMVTFNGEAGVDAGGITRDWFDTLGRRLVEEAESDNGRLMVLADKTLFPRPYEERSMDLLAIGRLAGLAVFLGNSLPIPLGSVACKFLLGEPISPKDVQRLDPEFYQFRVKPLLAPGGVGILESALSEPLMFMSAPTALRESKELCPGGAEKRVTEENKQEFIRLLCKYYLIGDREEQINIFLRGFWDIFPKDNLVCSGVTYRELALLISGYSVIDPLQWRANTQAKVGKSYGELIEWFWQIVAEMSEEDRAKLLHFVTGSSRLPSNGFAGLEPSFSITVEGEQDHLPQSHTCVNQLVLPPYSSKQMLVEKMQIAIANDEGFGFA